MKDGRAGAASVNAITGVRAVSANETFGPGFSACGGNKTMVKVKTFFEG